MEVDYKAAAFYLDVLQWLSIGVVAVWGYLRTKDNDNVKSVAAVARQLGDFIESSRSANEDLHTRLTTLQEQVRNMPTDQEVTHLSNDVSAIKAQISGVTNLLARVEHQTNLIHDHLLNKR